MPSKIIFSPEMDTYITDHVENMTINDISKSMGISVPIITNRIKKLHLWSYHLAFKSKKAKETKPQENRIPDMNVLHFKGGKQKDFYVRRNTEDGKKSFWKWAEELGYDIRHSSKVVFATNKTKRTIRFIQRLRNEFPEYKYKDLSQLSNLRHED